MRKIFLSVIAIVAILTTISCSSKQTTKPDIEFDAEKSLNSANERVERNEFDDARKILFEIKNRDLTKKYAPLAQLKIADSYIKENEYDAAVEEYKKFIDIYPDHRYASYAQFQIAMAYFVQIESPERGYGAAEKALGEFEKLKRLFPRNPYKEIIEIRIERCKAIIADYEYLVGEFYFKKESYKAAIGRFQYLLSRFPEYKKMPEALYKIVLSYKKLGDLDKASEYFRRLIEKFPNDPLISNAEKELAAGK